MEDNWYKTNEKPTEDWYSAALAEEAAHPPIPQPRPKRSIKWPVIITTLVLLLGTSLYALGHRAPEHIPEVPPASEETIKPEHTPIPDFGFSWSFGDDEDGGRDKESHSPDFYGSFQDFFDSYYTAFEDAEECTIPAVQGRSSLHIELEPAHGEILSLQELYAQCNPFIVSIAAYQDKTSDNYSYGTGVLISSDGYIITNSHIVEGTCRATVTLWDDREFEAFLVGNDPRSDVAVLKIEGKGLPYCHFATSDKLNVGDEVVALGNPLGPTFRSTMTNGIITGIDRDINYNGTTLTLIQTNAALNEGNSGGALINAYGQVIGITNMKMSNSYGSVTIEGVGFAIPSATVKLMADSIIQNGKVLGRPALGITVGAIPAQAATTYSLPEGLYVSEVKPGSDCASKGVQKGDVITRVDGDPVSDTTDVTKRIATMNVGDTMTLSIFRSDLQGGGEELEITVALVDVSNVY